MSDHPSDDTMVPADEAVSPPRIADPFSSGKRTGAYGRRGPKGERFGVSPDTEDPDAEPVAGDDRDHAAADEGARAQSEADRARLVGAVEQLRSHIIDVRADQTSTREALGALADQVGQRVDDAAAATADIVALKETIEATRTEGLRLLDAQAQSDADRARLVAAIKQLKSHITDVRADQTSTRDAMGALADQVSQRIDESSSATADIVALKETIEATRTEGLRLLDAQAQSDADRARLVAAIEQLESHIIDVRADQTSTREAVRGLAGQVSQRIDETSSATADIVVLKAAIDATRTQGLRLLDWSANENRRRDELMASTQEALQRLSGSVEELALADVEDRAVVERHTISLSRADVDRDELWTSIEGLDGALLHQEALELEHTTVLREQVADAVARIDELSTLVKRQAGQITRLRTDLNAATAPPPPSQARARKPKKAAATAAPATKRARPASKAAVTTLTKKAAPARRRGGKAIADKAAPGTAEVTPAISADPDGST